MTKYLVIETYKVQEGNPYWYPNVGNLEAQYLATTRTRVHEFPSEDSLANFLASNIASGRDFRVFQVSKELKPKFEKQIKVSFN